MDPMGHVLRSWNSLFTPWLWADSLDFLQCLGLWCSEKPTSHITMGRCSLASWDCVVCGGLAGSGKHSWFKKTIFVLLSFVALVIFNPSQLFSLVHITPWAAVLAQSRHSLVGRGSSTVRELPALAPGWRECPSDSGNGSLYSSRLFVE